MSNSIEYGPYVCNQNLEALQGFFPSETEPPKPSEVEVDTQIEDAPKAVENTPTLTARIKSMILNASERHVGSLKLSDARAATAQIRMALKAELKKTSPDTERFTFLSELSKAMGQDLDTLCRTAETSFAKLAKLKGDEIADICTMGEIVWEENGDSCGYVYKMKADYDPDQKRDLRGEDLAIALRVKQAAEILTSAMTAQMKLADHLEDLHRKTGCTDDALYEMATASRARACEMSAMVVRLGDYKKAKVDDSMLGMTASRLLGRFAVEMHGNDTTFDFLERELKPIADDLEALKRRVASGKKETLNAQSFAALRSEIAEAVKVLRQASEKGLQIAGPESRFILEASVMRAAEKHLEQLSADLTALETQAREKAAESLAEDLVPNLGKLSVLTDSDLGFLDIFFGPGKSRARTAFEDSLAALTKLSQKAQTVCRDRVAGRTSSLKGLLAEFNRHHAQMRTLYQFSKTIIATLSFLRGDADPNDGADLELAQKLLAPENKMLLEALRKAAREGVFASLKDLNPATSVANRGGVSLFEAKLDLVANRLAAMQKMTGADFAVDDPLLLGLFRGDYTAATYIGAKSWGMPPEALNPTLDDGALISSEPLGSGVANTVYLCTYRMPDGSEQKYVFKPEMTARLGMDTLFAGFASYTDDQKAASMNFAAKKLAEVLGTDTMMPSAYVGVHNGQFGLFMSVAPGESGKDLSSYVRKLMKNFKVSSDIATVFKSILTLPMSDDGVKALGSLVREVSALEWNDFLTGQSDRHWENYKVSYDKTAGKFSITGIDNDLSFPPWRLGAFKFRIRRQHSKEFAEVLQKKGINLANLIRGKKKGDEISLGAALPGAKLIVRGKDDYILDLTPPNDGVHLDENMQDFAATLCQSVFGLQRMSVPTFISADMRVKMWEIGQMDDNQIKAMLKIDLTDDQLEAFRSRIADALRYAEILAADSRQIEGDDWGKVENGENVVLKKIRQDFAEIQTQHSDPDWNQLRFLYGPLVTDFFAVNKFYFR